MTHKGTNCFGEVDTFNENGSPFREIPSTRLMLFVDTFAATDEGLSLTANIWNNLRADLQYAATAITERDRLKALNAELLAALEKCEHEMSEAYRRGLVDSLAPKGEASSFTQAITVARIAIASAK